MPTKPSVGVRLVVEVIPAVVDTAADRHVLAVLLGGEDASHGERFAVLEGIRQAGEEVAGCRHDFVAYRGVPVTNLDLQVVVGRFAVELGERRAVEPLRADLRVLELERAARFPAALAC